jgi:hypothetical protein
LSSFQNCFIHAKIIQMTSCFPSMHHAARGTATTQSHIAARRQELDQHHLSKKSTRNKSNCPTITATATCQRCNKKRLVRFGILAMALLMHCCFFDMNDASSSSSTRRRRSVYYYCHAFHPTSFHVRKRRSSSMKQQLRRPMATSSFAVSLLSSSVEEEENMDESVLLLSDGSFVKETFQERYGSSSSSLSSSSSSSLSSQQTPQPPAVLPDWLIQKCADCGWTHPTRIQQRALDVICVDKRDAIIQAETGSGECLYMIIWIVVRRCWCCCDVVYMSCQKQLRSV